MHDCENMVWGPVVLWQHIHEFLDPLMMETDIKEPHGGRWAHARWPPQQTADAKKNTACEHTTKKKEDTVS